MPETKKCRDPTKFPIGKDGRCVKPKNTTARASPHSNKPNNHTKKCKDPMKLPIGKDGRCVKPTTQKERSASSKPKSPSPDKAKDHVGKLYFTEIHDVYLMAWNTYDEDNLNLNEDRHDGITINKAIFVRDVYESELHDFNNRIPKLFYFVQNDTNVAFGNIHYFKTIALAKKFKKDNQLSGKVTFVRTIAYPYSNAPIIFTSEKERIQVIKKLWNMKRRYEEINRKQQEWDEQQKQKRQENRKKWYKHVTPNSAEVRKQHRLHEIKAEYERLAKETNAKAAYKKLALKYHPDKLTGNQEDFKILNNIHNGFRG